MGNKTERPEFGSRIKIAAIYKKTQQWSGGWRTRWQRFDLATPIEAIYIGYRQVYDCDSWWRDEDGWEIHRGQPYSLLLVVISEHKNPVHVAIADVIKS